MKILHIKIAISSSKKTEETDVGKARDAAAAARVLSHGLLSMPHKSKEALKVFAVFKLL